MNKLFSEPFPKNVLLTMFPPLRYNEILDYLGSEESKNYQIQIEYIESTNDGINLSVGFSLSIFDENYEDNVAPLNLEDFFVRTFTGKFENEKVKINFITFLFETFVYFSGFTEIPNDSLVEKFASFLKNSLDDYIKLR